MSDTPLRKDPIQGQIVHIYDGIEEADNALPRWWLITFFGAVIFGILYWMAYEAMPVADYPGEAYTKARLAALNSVGEVTDEDIMMLVEDPQMLAAGKATFMRQCNKCHGNKAEGKDGPNLTDNSWLYGGDPTQIYNTISNGTSKGMASWGPKLGQGAVKQVAAFVISLRNTNVPGKAAQGTPWVPKAAVPAKEAPAEDAPEPVKAPDGL